MIMVQFCPGAHKYSQTHLVCSFINSAWEEWVEDYDNRGLPPRLRKRTDQAIVLGKTCKAKEPKFRENK